MNKKSPNTFVLGFLYTLSARCSHDDAADSADPTIVSYIHIISDVCSC